VMETGPEGTRFEVVIPGAESREVEA
jgi:hypothetical protein